MRAAFPETGQDPRQASGRLTPPSAPRLDVRPPNAGIPPVVVAGVLLVLAVGLFTALEGRRRASLRPAIAAETAASAFPAPPPLIVPTDGEPITPSQELQPTITDLFAPALAPTSDYRPDLLGGETFGSIEAPARPPAMSETPRLSAASPNPAIVIDLTAAEASASERGAGPEGVTPTGLPGLDNDVGVRATRMRNLATIIPQGTVVPAVLETAIDSTRPGLTRAVVSRDVRGFDGARVLVPRGSRLIGEYRSEVAPGQSRALVIWTRLIRPDGVSIRLASPGGDPLGQGGVKGRVDSHFFQRFNGAILQSALDIGVAAASGGGSVVLGGRLGGERAGPPGGGVTPTIRVRQGAEVTIFVSRDLDFTGVTPRP